MEPVSRDILRAVLEARDHRHNETHSVLLMMFEGLVAELIEQQLIKPQPLADRLALGAAAIEPDPHGLIARDMLGHVVTWLRTLPPDLPPSHPSRWLAPNVLADGD